MSLSVKIKGNVRSGNVVSKSERKVKRLFFQNRQKYTFYSQILRKKIFVSGPASLLRKVMAFGSFDRYLIHCKQACSEFLSVRKEVTKALLSKKEK